MKIAIDVDDTLISLVDQAYAYGQIYNYNHNGNMNVINPNALYISGIYEWNEELENSFFKDVLIDVIANTAPKPLAKEVISQFKKEGHEIYIMTARQESYFPNSYENTKNWLNKYEIPYDNLYVHTNDKGAKCKELGIDILIDDIETNCLSAYENGVKAYIFHTICNCDFVSTDIKRVYSWPDVYFSITGKNLENI